MGTNDLKREFNSLKRIMAMEHVDEKHSLAFQKHLDKTKELTYEVIFEGSPSSADLIPYLQLNFAELESVGSKRISLSEDKDLWIASKLFLLDKVSNLIDYYKENFHEEFRMDFIAPKYYHQYLVKANLEVAKEILECLALNQVKIGLLQSLKSYFDAVQSPQFGKRSTYAVLEDFQQLLHTLKPIVKNGNSTELQEHITIELIRMNFNTPDFIDYCLYEINEIGNTSKIDWSKIKNIISNRKGFHPHHLGLYEVIDRVLSNHKEGAINLEKKHNALESVHYFKVIFTVRQLLFFFQVMMETGIVISRNRTGIFDFITRHIGTDKTVQLSKGSLQRKYGKTRHSDIGKVKDRLIMMINYINVNTN